MEKIATDCIFAEDGSVRVRRIRHREKWTAVEQGRQWRDDDGRHVLVMIGGTDVYEIVLSADTLAWTLKPVQGPGATVV